MKSSYYIKFLFSLFLVSFLLTGCGGGGSGSPESNIVIDVNTSSDDVVEDVALIERFNFPIAIGDFWIYQWSHSSSSTSSSGTNTDSENGLFSMSVLNSEVIDNITLYKIKFDGDYVINNLDISKRLTHLGVHENKIIGYDGNKIFTLMDATSGSWSGHALFTNAFDNKLVVVDNDTIDNSYISQDAYAISNSINKDKCEYILGQTICGDESYTATTKEYYSPAVGAIGFLHKINTSYSGGGYTTYHAITTKVGLISSSLPGDTTVLEVEPNDSIDEAFVINSLPIKILATGSMDDNGSTLPIKAIDELSTNNSKETAQNMMLPLSKITGSVVENNPGSIVGHTYSYKGSDLLWRTTTDFFWMEDFYTFQFPDDSYPAEVSIYAPNASDGTLQICNVFYDTSVNPDYLMVKECATLTNGEASFKILNYSNTNTPNTQYIAVNGTSYTPTEYEISLSRLRDSPTYIDYGLMKIHDYYKIVLDEERYLSIELEADDTSNSKDFDLYLFDTSGDKILASSTNYRTSNNEKIEMTLQAGTYYIGVDSAYDYYSSSKVYYLMVE